MKRQNLAAVPDPPAEETAPVDFDVAVSLAESDRWFVATILNKMAWSGGESAVLTLAAIHETLKLDKIALNKPAAKLDRAAKPYTLKASHLEVVLNVLCGGAGVGFQGEAGPMLAKLVARIRGQIEKARPEKA